MRMSSVWLTRLLHVTAVIFILTVNTLLFARNVMAAVPDSELLTPLAELKSANFSKKEQVVTDLSNLDDDRVIPILSGMLEGDLYYSKNAADVFVVLSSIESGYQAFNVMTAESTPDISKRDYKKISVNNSLRRLLRETLASLQLRSSNLDTRIEAARAMMKSDDEGNIKPLRQALQKEQNETVLHLLAVSEAMLVARHGESQERVAAIGKLKGELYPEVRSLLAGFLIQRNGEFQEPDADVRQAAADVLESIEDLVAFNKGIENVYFGISLGAVLLLAAVGLSITFGVMGVINMAHGEMIMLGAYTTYVIQQLMPNYIDYSLFVAIPAAFLVSGAVGVVIERGVIRHLYGRPLETLLATFGISLILQQAVRTIFSPLNQSVTTPAWMSGSLEINGALSLTYNRLYIILFSLVVLFTLALLLRKTLFGLQMRAVTQNRRMASSMGIRTGWLDALTFGLGSGIAGIAGVALSQLTNVGPNLGQAYIIDSFMVVVFGGVGNLVGTFVGAMSLGIANKLMEPFAGAVLAKILVLVVIILFIQKYPRGLFALKGRAAED
ncbi:urea ABC transporter permease subunit UrtB [Hahella sp. CCB-MM4]|uniref:urea ABC transporter permease subunit UrtB n=1 Tax=Hahella sp. (strain CCB-MM4) TaxID=1926491 RepID=UPI000B9B0514|nr:urea ABC transporter permease subunit UrtB [Hahella sp. CCB-MM4]OZG73879.1 urea ABC transporter permease subunit UrtB [Hahella sp. CCB-MM4]